MMKRPALRFPAGIVEIPPSKSVAHRALICAALSCFFDFVDCGHAEFILDTDEILFAKRAEGLYSERFVDLSPAALAASVGLSYEKASEDIRATAEGICRIVNQWNTGGLIDCGESGSTLRFLIPIAAMSGSEWTFTGRGRLLARPVGIYESLLRQHGALFEQTEEGGGSIRVKGPLSPGEYRLPGDVSSQFITGLLLALPLIRINESSSERISVSGRETETAKNGENSSEIVLTTALESVDYVRLTLDTMHSFGIFIQETDAKCVKSSESSSDAPRYCIPAGERFKRPADGYRVEGDWSQAAFFLCAGALGADVAVSGLAKDSLQGDRRILEILAQMGAEIVWSDSLVRVLPPINGFLSGVCIDARDIPDIVPPLAAIACYANGETRFTGAERLRIKESDRLAALASELSKVGADIRETADGLIICGRPPGKKGSSSVLSSASVPAYLSADCPQPVTVSAHGDHRIAMAMAVYAIRSEAGIVIDGAESVAKSYPNFWDDFEKGERP